MEVSGLGTTAENEVPYHHADTHPIYVQEFEVSVSDEHFSDLGKQYRDVRDPIIY